VSHLIRCLPLRDIDEPAFQLLRTNVNIPYLGKMYVDYNKIEKVRRKEKYYQDNVKHKEDEAIVQSDSDDNGQI